MKKFLIINGPNLNRLGKREPHIYGAETLDDVKANLQTLAAEYSFEITFKQSNHEGEIIDWIHQSEDEGYSGLIINPGAYTHYSYAIRDAIASVSVPTVEVHISNIHERETFRHTSVISPVTIGQIVGFGIKGYQLALLSFVKENL